MAIENGAAKLLWWYVAICIVRWNVHYTLDFLHILQLNVHIVIELKLSTGERKHQLFMTMVVECN